MIDVPRDSAAGTRAERAPRVAIGVLALLVVAVLAARWIAHFDPARSGDLVADKFLSPSATHLLGTDGASRDLLARLLVGGRISLGTALLAVGVVIGVGVPWGAIAGFAPGVVDRWMMRLVDAVLATPRLLIVLALVTFTGRLSPGALALLLGLTAWPQMSRLVRARVRELRATDYVAAARAIGTPPARVLVDHILPGTSGTVLAGAVMTIAAVIPLEAALTYFGVGVAPPDASWGTLLQDVSSHPLDHWWLLAFPSAAIAATVFCVTVIGEYLQRRAGVATR